MWKLIVEIAGMPLLRKTKLPQVVQTRNTLAGFFGDLRQAGRSIAAKMTMTTMAIQSK